MKKIAPTKKRSGCRTWLLIAFGLIVFGAVVSPRNQTAIFPIDTPEPPKRAATAAATVNIIIDVATDVPASPTSQPPTAAPSATPAPTKTSAPSATPVPATGTSKPKPTATRVSATRVPATAAPTKAPPTQAPTVAPAAPPTVAPPPADPGQPTFNGKVVSPAWWPCVQGQIKGNRNSMIYHVPTARDYARTYANVQCFNTEAEAQGAGYRRAQR